MQKKLASQPEILFFGNESIFLQSHFFHFFRKRYGSSFDFWTFLKCPISKSWPPSLAKNS